MSLLLALSLTAAGPAQAAAPVFPGQFQGRWAINAYECMGGPEATSMIEIGPRSWSRSDGGGDLTGVGAVRAGTHWYRVHNGGSDRPRSGMLGLRRIGARLAVTIQDGSARPAQYNLQRCRFG